MPIVESVDFLGPTGVYFKRMTPDRWVDWSSFPLEEVELGGLPTLIQTHVIWLTVKCSCEPGTGPRV